MMQSIRWAAIAAAVLCLAAASTASAGRGPCVREANAAFRTCHGSCVEGFQADKDACLNRDHACIEVCRAERAECRDATGLDAALAQCEATLDAARATCRANTLPGTPERDACIDAAQLAAFQCRDAAREAAKSAILACRTGFKTCALACAPASPPVDVPQCRRDAKAAFDACQAVCREDVQVARDACINRDHACVEQCRDDRATCRAPILATFDAAIAVCAATRASDVAACEAAFGAGTPELDQCIDNAQVTAFLCRDAAREAARPGIVACRQGFVTCVRACPAPPAP